MRVLVTGGAGFIGSAVCRHFIRDLGHDVVVIDKLTYAGNLASLALNGKPFVGLGASGMVMGALGLLAAQSLRRENWHGRSRKYLLGGVAAGVMLFVLFGLSPGTDMAAHLGGFVTGLALGAGLVFVPHRWAQSAKVNFVSIVLLVALVTATWLVAVRH